MAYQETIRYLDSFINYEKKSAFPYKQSFKLERIKEFLQSLGNPQDSLRCIHVAGTKGKGSACAFAAYILREAGYKVGLYTSPHLSDVRERIRILNQKSKIKNQNLEFGGMISRKELVDLVRKLRPAIEKYNRDSKYGPLSFFEVYTTLAFVYFKEKEVDFAVLETGLGGRLDATNTVNSLVCVITPISYDHTQKLGNTLKEIAQEKAGIIKGGGQVVISAPQEKEAREVIRNRCKGTGAKLYEVGGDINAKLGLLGGHQRVNAACAVAAVKALGAKINPHVIKNGLYNTRWPGRCEVIGKNPLLVLDGAQNVASCKALKAAVKENFSAQKIILVLGISRDKDIRGICKELQDFADKIILTKADNPRASEPKALAGYFKGKEVYLTGRVREAIILAKRIADKKDLILVTGSLFVIGEARAYEKHEFR